MRIAKVAMTSKRSSIGSRVSVQQESAMEENNGHFNRDERDEDSGSETNSTIGDHGLCLEKVESLFGIQPSGKVASGGSTSESATKSGRKLAVRKKGEEKQGDGSSSSTKGGKGSSKVPKVTLKLGVSSTSPSITVTSTISNSNKSSSSISSLLPGNSNNNSSSASSTSKSNMKSRSSSRLASASVGTNGAHTATVSTSHQQVASGGPQTPRTPGTPSDQGGNTPNPPTPGNTNSNSGMVNSPHQYVTITVDGEGAGVGNESGVNIGGNSSYVTYVEGSTDHSSLYAAAAAAAANGQTMTYPVYTVGDSSAMYSQNSSQYYSGSSGTPGATYSQDENEDGDDIGDGATPGGLTSADLNCILSCGSGDSSIMSSSPEADAMLQQHHALLDSGVYMVPTSGNTNNNNNSGTSEGEGPSSLSHATRVSPATSKRKRSASTPTVEPVIKSRSKHTNKAIVKEYNTDGYGENDYDSQDKSQDGNESAEGSGAYDSIIGSYLTDSEMRTLSKMHPMARLEGFGAAGSGSPAKICPESVQWLLDNYETAEGVSLPRSTLYNHYLRHCSENKLDPVNAASFGKLIRSVFLGLRTRRLGTRGNSKYHYYGIRLKPTSALNHLPDDFLPSGHIHGSMNRTTIVAGGHHTLTGASSNSGMVTKRMKTSKGEGYDGSHTNGFGIGESISLQQYLGDPTGALEDFPELGLDGEVEVPEGLVEDDLVIFRSLYREHCESMLEALASFQLTQVESLWRFFWRSSDGTTNLESTLDYEKILPKPKLEMLCRMKLVQEFVKQADYNFYQKVVGILLPDVLRPIPSTMTQAIRNFAKTLENWLSSALMGYPEQMVVTKISVVSALAQTLRRYTSLNHLAQAARAVLQNQNQISQMLSDLNRVDFHNVEEQASWVCGCDGDLVPTLEQNFKATLAQQQSLEQWAAWLEGVVDRVLHPHVNTPGFIKAARHFLLKWSFYSSLIIRDLTLRSAASFGSFHLLRLLYDEYMFYLVEHRVAQTSGIVPIAVIGKKSSVTSFTSLNDSIESSGSINGHSDLSSDTNTPVIGSVTSIAQGENQPTITHTNNNTAPSSYVAQPVKSELRRVKNFLTS